MGDVVYSESMTREEPYMEAMRRGLLQDVRGLQANRFGYNLVDKTIRCRVNTIRTSLATPFKSYQELVDKADGEWL